MTQKYYKYPRTFHFLWSENLQNDDRLLPSMDDFIGKEIVITEKMDGECLDENVLISTDQGEISIGEKCFCNDRESFVKYIVLRLRFHNTKEKFRELRKRAEDIVDEVIFLWKKKEKERKEGNTEKAVKVGGYKPGINEKPLTEGYQPKASASQEIIPPSPPRKRIKVNPQMCPHCGKEI
jgi:hypothetical protein